MLNFNSVGDGLPAFDVEHALNIYALSYATFPAFALYEDKFIERFKESKFHIYVIGFTPKANVVKANAFGSVLTLTIEYEEKHYNIDIEIPAYLKICIDGINYHLETDDGRRQFLSPTYVLKKIGKAVGGRPFHVKYIGQSYGEDGSRNSVDRLLKHETLQKIALKGTPAGFDLQLMLIEIQAETRVVSMFLPEANNKDVDGIRMNQGFDKLYGTTDAERISLYEASLIRYFSPEFNKSFKDSFPSTRLKILQDCYEKDFLALISEVCFDDFPFQFCSEIIDPKPFHIVVCDLQKDELRRSFFYSESKL